MWHRFIFCTFFSILTPFYLLSQPNKDSKRDLVWMFAYGVKIQSPLVFFGLSLDFRVSPPVVNWQDKPINLYITDASICDTAGNLILYTNGLELVNRKHKILANSSGFYSGELLEGLGLPLPQGTLILPVPASHGLYVVIHPLLKASNDLFIAKCSPMQYSLIDMSKDNGDGAAILLNEEIIADTLDNGMYTACRHANGRDWWILLPKLASNIYYRLLLDPTGLHVAGQQAIGPLLGSRGTLSQAVFSPDGTRYARTRGTLYFEPDTMGVYDFDRCTGLLSNPRLITHPTDSLLAGATLAISPNSRYLYKSLGVYMWQYDLQAADIKNSRKLVHTATKDSFFAMQLGPDGKIYICPAGGTFVLHRIDYPDLPGPACGVCEGCVVFPTPNFGSMPYFPNFRLGPLKGSPCDTLGLSGVAEVERGDIQYRLLPNPASQVSELQVRGHTKPVQVRVSNMLGQVIYRTEVQVNEISAVFPVGDWVSGCYVVWAMVAGETSRPLKLIVER